MADQDSIPYEDEDEQQDADVDDGDEAQRDEDADEQQDDSTRDYNSPNRAESLGSPPPLPVKRDNPDDDDQPDESITAVNSPEHKKPKHDDHDEPQSPGNGEGGASSSSNGNGGPTLPIHLADTHRPDALQQFQAFNDQQINIEHVQQWHFSNLRMTSDELHEYQNLMAGMAAEVSQNLHFMSEGKSPWQASEAHWVIPGPWKKSQAFYFDLETGEAIFAQSDDILTEAEIYEHWDKVDEADRIECRSFIDNDCFKARHTNQLGNNNIIDGTWVRRWKKTYNSKNEVIWIIKARMCGRGFLDAQRHSVMRHSSTASRLSQRLVASFMATNDDYTMETWDISTAFLQGLKYSELKRHAKQLGIEVKENREIYLAPPANVWRHFREYEKSTINISDHMVCFFVLLLLKPIYGTVDAPLLWQLALCTFIITTLKGIQSVFDDSFFTWAYPQHKVVMIWTVHVDDIIVLAVASFLT